MRLPVSWVCVVWCAGVCVAQPVPVDPPLKFDVTPKGGGRVVGVLTAYDAEGFEYRPVKGEPSRVAWGDLDARNIYLLHQRAFGKSATAEGWLDLGRLLLGEGDTRWSEQAFRNALKLDAGLEERIETIKMEVQTRPPAPEGEGGSSKAVGVKTQAVWGLLDEKESGEAVESLKDFARKAQEKIGHAGLQSFETDYFLFVTDLDAREAGKWNTLLDRMYAQLCGMFGVPRGVNAWHGKALVFTFKEREDFVKYEAMVENYQAAAGVAGLCHQQGPVVRIAFYRQPLELDFAHLLVHEASHGFIHRYRSPERIVSWANEGLSEWIAYDMVPNRARLTQATTDAREGLRQRGDTGGMFEDRPITGWQYPVAYTLTDFMIRQNRKGYVAFINAIKDGKEWRTAMEEDYGVTLDRLVGAYGQSIGAGAIRP